MSIVNLPAKVYSVNENTGATIMTDDVGVYSCISNNGRRLYNAFHNPKMSRAVRWVDSMRVRGNTLARVVSLLHERLKDDPDTFTYTEKEWLWLHMKAWYKR